MVAILFAVVAAFLFGSGLYFRLARKEFEFTLDNTVRVGRMVDVTLNGQRVPRCIYANTRAGVVHYYVTDARGELTFEKGTGDLAVAVGRGVVRVETLEVFAPPIVPAAKAAARDIRRRAAAPLVRPLAAVDSSGLFLPDGSKNLQ